MKKLLTAAATISMVSTASFAGGPVVIADEGEPAVVTKPSSGGWLPLLAGVVIICALACGGGDNNSNTVAPE